MQKRCQNGVKIVPQARHPVRPAIRLLCRPRSTTCPPRPPPPASLPCFGRQPPARPPFCPAPADPARCFGRQPRPPIASRQSVAAVAKRRCRRVASPTSRSVVAVAKRRCRREAPSTSRSVAAVAQRRHCREASSCCVLYLFFSVATPEGSLV